MSTVAKHRVHLTSREHARLRFTNVWRMRIKRHAFHISVIVNVLLAGFYGTLTALFIFAVVSK